MPCTVIVARRKLAAVFIIMLTIVFDVPILAVPFQLNRINVPVIIPILQIPHCTVISVTNEDILLPIVVTCQLLSLIIAAVVVLVVVVVNIVDVVTCAINAMMLNMRTYYTSDRSYNTPVMPTSDHQKSSSHSPPGFEPPDSFPFFSGVLQFSIWIIIVALIVGYLITAALHIVLSCQPCSNI